MLKKLFLVNLCLLGLSACSAPTNSEQPTPSETASPAASPGASSSPAASVDLAAEASVSDPVAAIKALATCVETSGTPAASVASTMTARADIAKMAMDQGQLEMAQQQYQFVRDAVLNLEKEYDFSCVK